MKNGSGSIEQAGRGHKLPRGLYALVDDGTATERSVLNKAALALEGGAAVLQLRFKATPERAALEAIGEVLRLVGRRVPVIVNDRVDWALLTGADGVHVGSSDVPVDVARRVLGPHALVGATTRSLDDILRAQRDGADHVGLGPIFPTTTKSVDVEPMGCARFEAIARASPLPIVGIAGVSLSNINDVARAGAWAAAVSSGLFGADDVVSRARALHQAFWAT